MLNIPHITCMLVCFYLDFLNTTNSHCLRNKSCKPECDLSFYMNWRIKFTNIRQPMLKLKTHSGFHDLFWFWYLSKSTNTVAYFDWKMVIYIYACGKCCTQFMLEKSVTFTGANANEIIPSITRSFFYKVKGGRHVRMGSLSCKILYI